MRLTVNSFPFIPNHMYFVEMATLVNTNLGGYRSKRLALHDELNHIQDAYGRIDVLTVQEFCDFRASSIDAQTTRIPPFFIHPPTTNQDDATHLSHCRGVATYALTQDQLQIQELQPRSEICTTYHTIKRPGRRGRGTRHTKLAIVNIYNNHNIDNETLHEDIQSTIDACKRKKYFNIILIGDFNAQKFDIPGFREHKHKDWFHKHSATSSRTHIDKCFANFDDIKILAVRTSLEKTAETDPALGHKTVVLRIFEPAPVKMRTSINYSKLGRLARSSQHAAPLKDKLTEEFWNETHSAFENGHTNTATANIDSAAELLVQTTKELIDKATKQTKKPRKMHAIINDAANLVEQDVKDQEKMKSFYNFVRNIKNGLDHENEHLPGLNAFKEKLEKKLNALNETNHPRTNAAVLEIYEKYPTAVATKLTFPPNSLMRYLHPTYYIPNPAHEADTTFEANLGPPNNARQNTMNTENAANSGTHYTRHEDAEAEPSRWPLPEEENPFLDDDDIRQYEEPQAQETSADHEDSLPNPGDPDAHPLLNFPDKMEFDRLIFSVNRSGATDTAGLTTKATSAILRQSTHFKRHLYRLFRAICFTGYIPKVFKEDKIVFLYKRKGDMLDPGNYRPITHAAAYGKHLEKILLSRTKRRDDCNSENHAYTNAHSIFSAIAELIATVDDAIKLNDTLLSPRERRDFKFIPIILAEDISGAFESLNHHTISDCIRKMHHLDHYTAEQKAKVQVKLDDLVSSYLDRSCIVSNGAETLTLNNRRGRSTPQGSSISPKFWRIHDQLFTHIYHKLVEDTLNNSNIRVFSHKHIAYADDHITVIVLKVPTAAIENPKKTQVFLDNVYTIDKTIDLFRQALMTATETVGSKINPAKTEIIVQPPYANHVTLAQQSFKWLGYTLELNKSGKLIITDDQLTKKTGMLNTLVDDVYSYITSLKTRVRIYKVWAAPMIEFFLLQEILDKNARSKLEAVQHRCICAALKLKRAGTPKAEVNKVILDLPIERKCQRFAATLATFPAVARLIEDDKLTAQDYASSKTTRQGTQIVNAIYNKQNTLTIAIDTLAQEWNLFRDEANALRAVKIDYDELPGQISALRQRRSQIIDEKTNS